MSCLKASESDLKIESKEALFVLLLTKLVHSYITFKSIVGRSYVLMLIGR